MVLIGLILAGPGALQSLGIQQPPSMYMWAQENKFTAIILLFVIGGQIEGQLLSTGAFEVYLNENLMWSKLDSGRLPSLGELKSLVTDEAHHFPTSSDGGHFEL
ncbi:Thioredoxin reductase-like selenoprotein T [Geodia barretti]|uniref:Thioredoxin reductase-like selenoprotein T n=1 Tax=Geodia barretti TaxID=519541 RepID=A0AA35TNZ7_GEOBA|nr:Thioredoxin reductase-like selenoprotein T [Geodia barretti]